MAVHTAENEPPKVLKNLSHENFLFKTRLKICQDFRRDPGRDRSAETELNSNVKIAVESIPVRNMGRDIGMDLAVVTCTDSSAAKGIQARRLCGKVKHLDATQLWCQEKVPRGEVKVRKVPRKDNPSDTLTHHWTGSDEHHVIKIGICRR